MCFGANAWATPSPHERQPNFGRTVTSTRYCAGTISRRSARSSPIRCKVPPQFAQAQMSGAISISWRGRWAGSDGRGASGARFFVGAVPTCSSASALCAWIRSISPMAMSVSSNVSSSWSGAIFSERFPKCMRLRTSSKCWSLAERTRSAILDDRRQPVSHSVRGNLRSTRIPGGGSRE